MNTLSCLTIVLIILQVNGFGRNIPSGTIFREVNSTINIVCTIDLDDKETEGLNSSYLSFEIDRNNISYTKRILNESSIEMIIPNAQADKSMVTCKLKNEYGVDMTRVLVGYKPLPVLNFKCISYNWQNMECTWKRPYNPIGTFYDVRYSIDNNSLQTNLCDQGGDYLGGFWCQLDFSSMTSVYRQNYPFYYFTVTSNNNLGNLTENIIIDHYKSVIPARPELLHITNITSNSAVIKWNIPYQLITFPRPLIHYINYTAEFYNGVWRQFEITTYQKKSNEFLLRDLEFAYAWYDVRISTRVLNSIYHNLPTNFTSTTFHTLPRIPDEPPKVDKGGFNVDDNGNIYLYWKEIPVSKRNGRNPTYNITIVRGGPSHIRPNLITNTMAKFDHMSEFMRQDLVFHIRSSNDEGSSVLSSVITVPKRQSRLKHPVHFKKILHDRVYHLSWNPPPTHDDIHSYTVFWCVTKNEFLNRCAGSINFQRVTKFERNFTHSSDETLNFAVSANSKFSSSGMVWAKCTAGSVNDIGKLSTIWIARIESTSIEFKWTLECVDQTIVNGFNLSYCPIKDPKTEDCKENLERYINITKDDSLGYTLTNLTPYTTYKTVISMYSSQRASPGPPSEPLINTTLEAAPSPPRNLEYTNVTDNSVILHWDIPEYINGVLMKYKVWYNSNFKEIEKQHLSPNMTYKLTGLNSYTKYDILVTASTVTDSNRSNIVTIETKVGVPGNITQPIIFDEKDFYVEWYSPAHPNGQVQFYEVEVRNKAGNQENLLNSTIKGTRCTYHFKKCDVGVDEHSFRVRAVNVINSPFEKDVSEPSNIAIEVAVCAEEDDYELKKIIYSDKHATILRGNWSFAAKYYCNQSEYASGGWYVVWAIFTLLGICVVSGSILITRKFKNMKDIKVTLPPGLEDIKEEVTSKEFNEEYRPESTKIGFYTNGLNEQEQSLLRNRAESGSSQNTENLGCNGESDGIFDSSESMRQNSDRTLSESLETTTAQKNALLDQPFVIRPVKLKNTSYPKPSVNGRFNISCETNPINSLKESQPAAPQVVINSDTGHESVRYQPSLPGLVLPFMTHLMETVPSAPSSYAGHELDLNRPSVEGLLLPGMTHPVVPAKPLKRSSSKRDSHILESPRAAPMVTSSSHADDDSDPNEPTANDLLNLPNVDKVTLKSTVSHELVINPPSTSSYVSNSIPFHASLINATTSKDNQEDEKTSVASTAAIPDISGYVTPKEVTSFGKLIL